MGEFEEKLNSILSSPKEMEKILGLARELSGSGGEKAESPPPPPDNSGILGGLGDMDPKLFKVMGRLMGEYTNKSSDKADLVTAMKPYVRAERREALDRALKITKIARIAKIAFSELGGGDFDFDL